MALDILYKIMYWLLWIVSRAFAGGGLIFWCFSFTDPEAAAEAIACLLIAVIADYARKITPTG